MTDTKTSKNGILEIANRQGMKAYTENGRIKIETSRPGDLIRLWASIGADVIKTHDGKNSASWTIHLGGEYIAALLFDKENSFAYSFTTC